MMMMMIKNYDSLPMPSSLSYCLSLDSSYLSMGLSNSLKPNLPASVSSHFQYPRSLLPCWPWSWTLITGSPFKSSVVPNGLQNKRQMPWLDNQAYPEAHVHSFHSLMTAQWRRTRTLYKACPNSSPAHPLPTVGCQQKSYLPKPSWAIKSGWKYLCHRMILRIK